jgi:RNA polymerase sigma factor (sigma-70 family)
MTLPPLWHIHPFSNQHFIQTPEKNYIETMFGPKDTSALSDLELISRFKKSGELNLLGILFSRYASLVYGVSLKYLKKRDDAKDSVMQIFEKLAIVLREHEVENFKSWLYVTVRNHCLMQLRSKKNRFPESLDINFMENERFLHLEEEPETEQNLTKLEKCVDKLDGDQKQCISLFFLQERCYKEITELTGFDLNKVKSHIQNGKRNLKICMEKNV